MTHVTLQLGDVIVYEFAPQKHHAADGLESVSYQFPSIRDADAFLHNVRATAMDAAWLQLPADGINTRIPADGLYDAIIDLGNCRPRQA